MDHEVFLPVLMTSTYTIEKSVFSILNCQIKRVLMKKSTTVSNRLPRSAVFYSIDWMGSHDCTTNAFAK